MDALDTMQRSLDLLSRAILAGDWPAYRRLISLPLFLVTAQRNLVISDEAHLRAGFDELCATFAAQRVTDYIRLAESAANLEPELLTGRYITHLLSGGHRLVAPYRSQMTLRLEGGVWQVAAISNAMALTHWTSVFAAKPSPTDLGKDPT
jgi:hypothetical protein